MSPTEREERNQNDIVERALSLTATNKSFNEPKLMNCEIGTSSAPVELKINDLSHPPDGCPHCLADEPPQPDEDALRKDQPHI